MNQNMFSLIKQIEYWLPMLRKVLSNKIQVTKKKRKYKSLRENKERTLGWLPLPSKMTQGFTFSFQKKEKIFKPDVLSLFLLPIFFFLNFLSSPPKENKTRLFKLTKRMNSSKQCRGLFHSIGTCVYEKTTSTCFSFLPPLFSAWSFSFYLPSRDPSRGHNMACLAGAVGAL